MRYCLAELFVHRGVPPHIRSDNGLEFSAKAVRTWLSLVGGQALFITPGTPWENGYIESFTGKLRDELLDRELLDTHWEVKALVDHGRLKPITRRPNPQISIGLHSRGGS